MAELQRTEGGGREPAHAHPTVAHGHDNWYARSLVLVFVALIVGIVALGRSCGLV